ncbi:hypothetical protein PMM47T1_24099 [Pseudomonas sp. M47T1]|uniref:hypothetical protein n=1 Tax=Pseudomonas sp. M47T1 TaxID=1179778 RepID=UPI0002607DFB|nr:hypothetical protein [Pseudomonas sp. M47T1]EIK94032.1 hypothetical protein PMM47T1_24099 [Pseudomonas sp. M47T1]
MSKIIQFQAQAAPEIIDEAHYDRYADAALLLKCFEIVKDAIEVINEPEYSIEKEDDMHVDLIRAFYALRVLFKRKTGHDAAQVAQQHWDAMTLHLLEGAALPDMSIPLCGPLTSALPPEYFEAHSDLQLACAAFNHSDQVRLGVSATLAANNAQIAATMAIEAINSTTALRKLVLRLSGGTMEALAAHVARKPGETLQ